MEVGEKLHQVFENIEFIHKQEKVVIAISISTTHVKTDDDDIDGIFDIMDKSMYKAKHSGRNRVERTI